MFYRYKWTIASLDRNKLTEQYEPVQVYFFTDILDANRSEFFFDIGANIGQYSILASRAKTLKKIITFEPEANAYAHLIANVNENNLGHLIAAFQVLVSDVSGFKTFGIVSPMAGNNGIIDTSIHDKNIYKTENIIESIEIDKVNNICQSRISFKIDVEGHEMNVLRGAKETLIRNICVVQIESYENSKEISTFMDSIKYKKILQLGPDFYFTNNYELISESVILKKLQESISRFIQCNVTGEC